MFSFSPFILQSHSQKGLSKFSIVLSPWLSLFLSASTVSFPVARGNQATFPLGKFSLCTRQPKDSLSFLGKWLPGCWHCSCYSPVSLDIILHYTNKYKISLFAQKPASACVASLVATWLRTLSGTWLLLSREPWLIRLSPETSYPEQSIMDWQPRLSMRGIPFDSWFARELRGREGMGLIQSPCLGSNPSTHWNGLAGSQSI